MAPIQLSRLNAPARNDRVCFFQKTALSLHIHASDMKKLTFILTAALLLLLSEAAFAQRKGEKTEPDKGGWLAIKVVNGHALLRLHRPDLDLPPRAPGQQEHAPVLQARL